MSGRYAIKTPPQHGTWREFLDVWLAADQIDVFESAWTMDHFYPLTPPMDGTHLESWTMLAALAQATTRLRLGAMVNGMHYRHPAVTANMAVTVDHISNGRFVLGLGAGWFEPESNAYGIPLGSLKERFDRLDEGVPIIRSLLDNEHTTFSGRFYELTDARCEPKPVQAHLPIAIGGKGKRRTLRTVARYADQWDVTFPPDVAFWLDLDETLRAYCDELGRDADGDHALDPPAVRGRRRPAADGRRRAAVLRGGRRPRDLLDARAVRGAPRRSPRRRVAIGWLIVSGSRTARSGCRRGCGCGSPRRARSRRGRRRDRRRRPCGARSGAASRFPTARGRVRRR